MLDYDIITSHGIQHVNKIEEATHRLKTFEPEEGYYLAFSGGKDSQCVYHLAKMAGVRFDAHYRVTSVDPPELIRFIREQYPDVIREIPRDVEGKAVTMWSLIPHKTMPPTRLTRYCCAELKETGGAGRITVTGVRWAESAKRAKSCHLVYATKGKERLVLNDDNDESRRMVEQCYRTRKTIVNPIVDWEDSDVWEFLNEVVKVPHCCLYDDGLKRLGCIGCPLSHNASSELERWPAYKRMYLHAFERMIAERRARGKPTWKTPQQVMDWWLGKATKQLDGQMTMDEIDGQSD